VSPDSQLYLSFNWAYARSDPSFSDELLILLSTDCGTNFTQIFYRTGGALATGPTQTTPFVPTANQWKSARIILDNYKDEQFVQVKIVNVTDGGNNLYIDDLYIGDGSELTSSIDDVIRDVNFSVSPNPVIDDFTIRMQLDVQEKISISLFNTQGVKVFGTQPDIYLAGAHMVMVPAKDLPSGIYYIALNSERLRMVEKILVQK
jgi:hypothetical protein